jgi:hypothetical protein
MKAALASIAAASAHAHEADGAQAATEAGTVLTTTDGEAGMSRDAQDEERGTSAVERIDFDVIRSITATGEDASAAPDDEGADDEESDVDAIDFDVLTADQVDEATD